MRVRERGREGERERGALLFELGIRMTSVRKMEMAEARARAGLVVLVDKDRHRHVGGEDEHLRPAGGRVSP